jgi:hypothetical protein
LKTISVKEAAAALGLTPRAVSYRLEKGQLKGTLSKNETTGVPEWRIYPNKEILSGLSQAQVEDTTAIDFEPNDVIEAESVNDTADDAASEQSAARPGAMDFQLIVEQCVRPLVEEVKAQALALAEKDRIIQDQSRQLRLLPDFQKRAEDEKARAEEERKAAELRALEIEALNKQVAAMEEEKQELETKANEATVLANDLEALKQTVEKLQQPWWKKWFSSSDV